MSYPVRLQVASLVGNPPEEPQPQQVAGSTPGPSRMPELPPVAGGTDSPVRRAVFVIGEATKRPRSAGVLGCGRVAPLTQVDPPPQDTQGVQTQRPRSSPHLACRRHPRVTPLTPSQVRAEESEEGVAGSRTSGSPVLSKWRRGPSTHVTPWNTSVDTSPWKTPLCSGEQSPPPPVNASPHSASTQGKASQWLGRSSVPTINIDTHDSSSSSTSLNSHHTLRSSVLPYSDANNFTNLENNKYVTERIHSLVSAFSLRASRVKAHITQPPTPSTDLSEGGEDPPLHPAPGEDGQKAGEVSHTMDSVGGEGSATGGSEPLLVGLGGRRARLLRHWHAFTSILTFPHALEPQSRLYIWWLLVVSIMYVYNAWVIPLRSVFTEYQTPHNLGWWLAADTLADLVYILDIVVFKSRVMYLDNGFWISSGPLMRRHYMKTSRFWYDLVSLLPLDLLYFKFGPISVFRIPRLLKIHTFWEFFNRLDSVLSSPHAVRVIRTVLYMLYLIHLNTCAYYGFSKIEGIGSNRWVFQGIGNAYIRCFYFATKTATSIGKNPKPENEAEYLFMTCSWLMGVFVFALLIGQIRDIVATATRNQNEYRRVMDHTQAYLHRLNLPSALQERIRLWFSYTWQSQKTLNEMKCLESLPRKMRTDLAISVHIQTLSKVQLFQDCDKALLRDLVLKLQPVLYLPGDFVCKKGEVGKEMYIVQSGQVLVMGGEQVLATLGEGSVFGEISLLALAGGNRRTANVRSRGFSSLFVLSKADLQATIKDYPEAQEILKKKAKKLIRQNEERERQEPTPDENIIIKSRETTPKLLHTVLQVVRPDSYTASVIWRSSRTVSQSSLQSPCPWTSSQASPFTSVSSPASHDPLHSRASLGVPSSTENDPVRKVSLSKSLPEEEEDELVGVENNDGTASPASSCFSHHTSITLQPFSPPSSPSSSTLPRQSPHNSTPPLEEGLESEVIQEKPIPGLDNSGIESEGKDEKDEMKPMEGSSKSTPGDGGPSCPSQDHNMPVSSFPKSQEILKNLSLNPSLRQGSQKLLKGSHTCTSSGKQRNNNNHKQLTSNRQQINTGHEGVAGVQLVSDQDREKGDQVSGNGSVCRPTTTGSSAYPNNRKNGSIVRRTLSAGPASIQTLKIITATQSSCSKRSINIGRRSSSSSSTSSSSSSSTSTSTSTSSSTSTSTSSTSSGSRSSNCSNGNGSAASCQEESLREENSPTVFNLSQEMEKAFNKKIPDCAGKVIMTDQQQFSDLNPLSSPSRGALKGSQKRSLKQQIVPTVSSSEACEAANKEETLHHNTSNSTEDLLIKFGLSSGNSKRDLVSTSLTEQSLSSPVSYDLFLDELSKTMPNTLKQVPPFSSPSPSFSVLSGPPSQQHQQEPLSLTPCLSPSMVPSPPATSAVHRISCSAIVHRECVSPDTSPFDAQESKL